MSPYRNEAALAAVDTGNIDSSSAAQPAVLPEASAKLAKADAQEGAANAVLHVILAADASGRSNPCQVMSSLRPDSGESENSSLAHFDIGCDDLLNASVHH